MEGGTFHVGLNVMYLSFLPAGVLRVSRLTDNNAHQPYRFALLHHRQGVVREIYHHIGSTQFPRQPPPALHISKDGINSRSRNLGLTTPVLVSALYFGLGRRVNSVPFFSGASKSSLKLFVLRLLSIFAIQSGSDIVAAGNFFRLFAADRAT